MFRNVSCVLGHPVYKKNWVCQMHLKNSFEIYIDVTFLSLCKTNVKISGEISQAYLNYGLLNSPFILSPQFLVSVNTEKQRNNKCTHVHSSDMLQINYISRQAKLKVMTT